MSRLRVGLTGGLASGKSTVARWLAEAGFRVVDADRLVAELYAPGGAGAAAVAELFGKEALTPEGGVDHRRLALTVFRDAEARRRLEAAIHPLVRRRFAEVVGETEGIAVLEATLLVEAGLVRDFDLVVTVEAPEEIRLRRAVERGLSEGEARARLAAQASSEARRAAAGLVLDNGGELAALTPQVAALIAELRRRADAATA